VAATSHAAAGVLAATVVGDDQSEVSLSVNLER